MRTAQTSSLRGAIRPDVKMLVQDLGRQQDNGATCCLRKGWCCCCIPWLTRTKVVGSSYNLLCSPQSEILIPWGNPVMDFVDGTFRDSTLESRKLRLYRFN